MNSLCPVSSGCIPNPLNISAKSVYCYIEVQELGLWKRKWNDLRKVSDFFCINMWVCNCASLEGKERVRSSWERKRQRDSPLDQREEETTQGPDYCSCWDLRVRQTFGNGVSMLSETFYGGYPPYHITILLLALLQWEMGSRMTPLPLFWEQEVQSQSGTSMHPLLRSCWVLYSFGLWNRMAWWISETFLEMTDIWSFVNKIVPVLTDILCLVLDTVILLQFSYEFLMIWESTINTRKGQKIPSPTHFN